MILRSIYVFAAFFLCSCLNATHEAQDEPFPLETLPNEVIVMVYDFLSPQETRALSSVNRLLRSLRPIRKITARQIGILRLIFEDAPREVASYLNFDLLVELHVNVLTREISRSFRESTPREANIKTLTVSLFSMTNEDLATLVPGLTQLRKLGLSRNAINNEGIAHLTQLTQLQNLDLSWTYVTDAGTASLTQLTQLQKLNLSGCTTLTDSGIAELVKLTQLQKLGMSHTRVTHVGIALLAALTALQKLNLSCTQVTDAEIIHLVKLTQLQKLYLYHTQVSDEGLAQLTALSALQKLNVSATRVSDAGLAHLAELTALWELDLSHTPTSKAGIAALQEHRPGLKILLGTLDAMLPW